MTSGMKFDPRAQFGGGALPVSIAGADTGAALEELCPATGAALVRAGPLSVLLLQQLALALLRSRG